MKLKLDSIKNRLSLIIVLMVAICCLSIYYADNVMYHGQYSPIITALNYPQGQVVSISGTVFSQEKTGFLVGENYQGNMRYYHVISNITAYPGDYISFNGVLGPNYSVTIEKSEVVPPWSYEFELLRSIVVVPFLFVLFILYWRFDFEKLAFVRRN
jgi:hypothetical protein